jgi:kynurenine--oxoglutarate transaminase/cysteine-S-conjugate beta-lyase/glutamine--phenylpyruvate transaminase
MSTHFMYIYCRVEYIQLALDHKPLNLGQGFPDFAAPDYVTKALSEVATGENVLLNQYTRGFVSPVFTVLFNLRLL